MSITKKKSFNAKPENAEFLKLKKEKEGIEEGFLINLALDNLRTVDIKMRNLK